MNQTKNTTLMLRTGMPLDTEVIPCSVQVSSNYLLSMVFGDRIGN